MSSNWPTTCDTFVRTILKAISSSPMISNLSNRAQVSSSNRRGGQEEHLNFYCMPDWRIIAKISLVFILVSESFVDTVCDWLAMEDEAFCHRRLWIRKKKKYQLWVRYFSKTKNLQSIRVKIFYWICALNLFSFCVCLKCDSPCLGHSRPPELGWPGGVGSG